MDPKVTGQLQHEWRWRKAVYLFLGGLGAGAYCIAALSGFFGPSREPATTVGLWIGFPAVLLGSLILLTALGAPTRAVLAARKQGSSWISRGTVILSAFMAVAFLHLVLARFTGVDETGTGMDILAVAGIVLGVGTMVYTGILLGASKGIPFWRTGVVPVLFVVSALVTGYLAILLGVMLFGEPTRTLLRVMTLEAVVLMVLEGLAVAFFLQAAYRAPDSRESAERMVRKSLFAIGYLALGLAVPLGLLLITHFTIGADPGSMTALVVIGALLGLAGRLILRQAVLACGAFPTLNMAGFEFRRIARPKEPKPDIGLLPPR
jgi:formate-dependent nitrite reductase membrane component NrfD